MMSNKSSLGLGICGIGGYAGSVAQHIWQHGPTADPPLRLVAACDPNWRQLDAQVALLRHDDVDILDSYAALLGRGDIDAVWLPLPIHLHRPFTQRALGAGKFVMCEKPAAGCIDDVDAMIAARDAAGLDVLVGFQDAYLPTTARIKRMLLDGVIGRVTHATLLACWPRDAAYFERNSWAGQIKHEGTWVLDSPANNALAHYINLLLMLLGSSLHQAAIPCDIEAELYRGASIENYDTISARATFQTGQTMLVLMTHACAQTHGPIIEIHGDRGCIRRDRERYTIITPDAQEVIELDPANLCQPMVHTLARAIVGADSGDSLRATLEVARQQTVLVNGASEAAGIISVPDDVVVSVIREQGTPVQAISGIEAAFEQCIAQNIMLHELGRYDFTQTPGRFDLRGYKHFTGGKTSWSQTPTSK